MRITGGIPVGGNLGYFNTSFGSFPSFGPLQKAPPFLEDIQNRFDAAKFLPYALFSQEIEPQSWRSIYKFAHEDVNPHSLY